ncbi:alpha/beta fold hydrolase [Amycolatopsis sp. YIM 10]|uniref:alpha/beta fold hydrolase n=1 Tax=Amycolatopsis sp. YIM 10 TaxID=2653857 RepID=UPI00129082AD|nr:alpha/beta hydrolase [Amycolatopsis sp. YIM 10]QFU94550.1 Lipase 1 precursor [Amycolatopsis sp. YIM 10]
MGKVAFDRTGSGEPLVLIHGVGHRRQAWAPVVPLLAPHREVISVDVPGFGESPMSDKPFTLENGIEAMAEFFAEQGLDRPHVAGNSMGGLFALGLGQRGLVRSVTALSPAGLWTRRQQLHALRVLRAHRRAAQRMPAGIARRLAASPAGRRAMVGLIVAKPARLAAEVVLDDMRAFASAPGFAPAIAAGRDIRFDGRVADVPVTIAWGQYDRIVFPPRVAELRRIAPGAELLRLPGCGHVPMSDDPELVAHVLLSGSEFTH